MVQNRMIMSHRDLADRALQAKGSYRTDKGFRAEENYPMSVALYARVSTTNGQDPKMQLREMRQHVEKRGWHVAEEYVDAGISGTQESRPRLNAMMADAKRRRFDAALVWKLDRFARSLKHW